MHILLSTQEFHLWQLCTAAVQKVSIKLEQKIDAADEFFRADTDRNQAYDIADDYKNIVQEDRPGEDDEINKQVNSWFIYSI